MIVLFLGLGEKTVVMLLINLNLNWANPLLVTFSPLIPSKIGEHNRNELVKLGFDHICKS